MRRISANKNFRPLVSIIIPVFNGSDYIAESVSSALKQTYTNLEVIIVNDGSNDDSATERIVKSFKDSRIRYFYKENGGISSALNFGVSKSLGEYISWLSHDDLYSNNKIENEIKFICSHPKKCVPFCKNIFINSKGKVLFLNSFLKSIKKRKYSSASDFFRLRVNYSSMLVERAFLLEHPFLEKMNYSQDYYSQYEILTNNHQIEFVKGCAVFYRIHPKQASQNKNNSPSHDILFMHNSFLDYYSKTNDIVFLKRYFLFLSKKSNDGSIRDKLYKELVSEFAVFLSEHKIFRFRLKIRKIIFKFLYWVKGCLNVK